MRARSRVPTLIQSFEIGSQERRTSGQSACSGLHHAETYEN